MSDDDNWGMDDPAFDDASMSDNEPQPPSKTSEPTKTTTEPTSKISEPNKKITTKKDDSKTNDNSDDNLNDMDFEDDENDDEFNDNDDEWDDIDENNNTMDKIGASALAQQNIIQNEVPSITSYSINNNCNEINMLPMFYALPDLKSRSRVGCLLFIDVHKLRNITLDQLQVWGLSKINKYIGIRFEFGGYYLSEGKAPKVKVGMCDKISLDTELKVFRLSWTIADRLKNTILSNKQWPTKIDMKLIPNVSHINDLMESTNKEYSLCLEALKLAKNDATEALNILLDNNQLKKLYNKIPTDKQCNIQFQGIMGKIDHDDTKIEENPSLVDEYKNADIDSQAKQLSEMFGISKNIASFAIQQIGYDKVINKITTDKNYLSEITMIYTSTITTKDNNKVVKNVFGADNNNNNNNNNKNKKPKKGGLFSKLLGLSSNNNDDKNKNNNNNNNNDDNKEMDIGMPTKIYRTESGQHLQQIQSEHFLKTIVTMTNHNFLIRVLCFSLKILLNANKYCIVCDKKLAFAGLMPTICSSSFCQFRHDQIGLGFSLANVIKDNGIVMDLLITLTYSACTHGGRIRFFFPHGVRGLDNDTAKESFLMRNDGKINEPVDLSTFDEAKFIAGDASQPQPDINKLKLVIDKCPSVDDLTKIAIHGDVHLKKELKKIHCLLYPLLCWIVTSNRSHLRQLNKDEKMKELATDYQFAICSSTPDKEAEFQRLQESNGSFLAWHGSPLGNWHSIFRMGLRNYSGTKHQSNGQAYGKGIYFARNFNLSWSYSNKGQNIGWSKSMFGSRAILLALCEICYHKDDAAKNKITGFGNNDNNEKSLSTKGDWTKMTDKKNRWVKTSGIYVVEDEKCVMTRFFLVFKAGAVNKNAMDANSIKIPKVVREFE